MAFRRVVLSGEGIQAAKKDIDNYFKGDLFNINYPELTFKVIVSPVKQDTLVVDVNGEGADTVSRKVKDFGKKHKMKAVIKLEKPTSPVKESKIRKSQLKQLIKEEIFKVLTESKQVGTLYHFTTFTNAVEILKSNSLKRNPSSTEDDIGGIRKGISTTRRSYDNWVGSWPEGTFDDIFWVRFKLDGDKLSNKYEIVPYSWKGGKVEFEELIKTDIISNLKQYLLGVDIFTDRLQGSANNLIKTFPKLDKDQQNYFLRKIDELEQLYPQLKVYIKGKYIDKNQLLQLLK